MEVDKESSEVPSKTYTHEKQIQTTIPPMKVETCNSVPLNDIEWVRDQESSSVRDYCRDSEMMRLLRRESNIVLIPIAYCK